MQKHTVCLVKNKQIGLAGAEGMLSIAVEVYVD